MIFNHMFHTRVRLEARWMYCEKHVIDREILQHIQRRYGNICNAHGYVYGTTIMITERRPGVVDTILNNGDIIYNVTFSASVCKPGDDEIIQCTVVDKNTEGIRCLAMDPNLQYTPLDIIMPIRWHPDNIQKKIATLSISQPVTTRVVGCRFSPGDKRMSVVVEFVCIEQGS